MARKNKQPWRSNPLPTQKKITERPQEKKPPPTQRKNNQTRRLTSLATPKNKQTSTVILFVSTLVLLGFAMYLKADSPAFYTFLSAALACIFGRRIVG